MIQRAGRGGERGKRWVVVLAGGEGARLRPFVERWLGQPKPKQYCAFVEGRSMLELTHRRALHLAPPERIWTVIGPNHRRYLERQALCGGFLEQPANLDTAVGIFLAVARVIQSDPDATLLILPSDHYVHPESRFIGWERCACDAAERHPDRIVLLGAVPDSAEIELGWIETGPRVDGSPAMEVASFREKPDAETASEFLENGFIWNTMVTAAKASALWEIGALLLPEMTRTMASLAGALGTPAEPRALSAAYGSLRGYNFSRDLLERAPDRTLVIPMEGVEWSDWGRPSRIACSLRKLGDEEFIPRKRDLLLALEGGAYDSIPA